MLRKQTILLIFINLGRYACFKVKGNLDLGLMILQKAFVRRVSLPWNITIINLTITS